MLFAGNSQVNTLCISNQLETDSWQSLLNYTQFISIHCNLPALVSNSLTHLAFVMQWITRLMLSLLPDCARLNAEKGAFSTRSRVESCQRRLNPVALSVLSHGKNYDCHCPRCGPGAKDTQGCHCFHTCSHFGRGWRTVFASGYENNCIFGARATTRAMTIIIFAMTEN